MHREKVKIFNSYNSHQQLEKDINNWLESGNINITRVAPVVENNTHNDIVVFIFYRENFDIINDAKEFFKD